jgi:hypothetical protein
MHSANGQRGPGRPQAGLEPRLRMLMLIGLGILAQATSAQTPPGFTLLAEHKGFRVLNSPAARGDCRPSLYLLTDRVQRYRAETDVVGDVMAMMLARVRAACPSIATIGAVGWADDTEKGLPDPPMFIASAERGWELWGRGLGTHQGYAPTGYGSLDRATPLEQASARTGAAPDSNSTSTSRVGANVAALAPRAPAPVGPVVKMARLPSNAQEQVDIRCVHLSAQPVSPSAREICNAVQLQFLAFEQQDADSARRLHAHFNASTAQVPKEVQGLVDGLFALGLRATPVRERLVRNLTLNKCDQVGYAPETKTPVVECSYRVAFAQKNYDVSSREALSRAERDETDKALFLFQDSTWLRFPGVYSKLEWRWHEDQVARAAESNRSIAESAGREREQCRWSSTGPSSEQRCMERVDSRTPQPRAMLEPKALRLEVGRSRLLRKRPANPS